jgi:putative hydrolase of the HAD superfamily
MRGAAETLHRLIERGIPIGIVSNAQRYTLPELEAALAGEGLTVSCFAPDLVFWSFQHGFSKPNPHVFRILAHRCRLRGIEPGEVWMVGDNFENDVEASELHGFRAWHLTAEPTTAMAGPWMAMHQALFAALSDGAS